MLREPMRSGQRLLLVAVSTLVALGALGIAARFADPGWAATDEESALYLDADPVLGWRKRPAARVSYIRPEYSVELSINGRGQRDVERTAAPDPDALRILALGDSFVEGYTVSLESSLTRRPERTLEAPGCAVEVVNAGTIGYSTDQEYLYYRGEDVRERARIVLIFFFYNDVLANALAQVAGRPKPLLAPHGDELRLTNAPLATASRAPRAASPAPASAALGWLRARIEAGAPALHARLGTATGRWRRPQLPDELRVYQVRRQPGVEAAWDLTRRILAALETEVSRRGAHLALIYVPSRFEVDAEAWQLMRQRYDLGDGWDRQQVWSRLREIAETLKVPALNLDPALRAAPGGGAASYLAGDGHWSTAGHAAAASGVAGSLRTQTWLPACASAR